MEDKLFNKEYKIKNLEIQLTESQKINEDLKSEMNKLKYRHEILENDFEKLSSLNGNLIKQSNETKNKLKASEAELTQEKKKLKKLSNVESKSQSTLQKDENTCTAKLKSENERLADIVHSFMSDKNGPSLNSKIEQTAEKKDTSSCMITNKDDFEKQLLENESQIKNFKMQLAECKNLNFENENKKF